MSCFLKIAEHVGLISVSNQLSLQVLSHLSSLKLQQIHIPPVIWKWCNTNISDRKRGLQLRRERYFPPPVMSRPFFRPPIKTCSPVSPSHRLWPTFLPNIKSLPTNVGFFLNVSMPLQKLLGPLSVNLNLQCITFSFLEEQPPFLYKFWLSVSRFLTSSLRKTVLFSRYLKHTHDPIY